MNSTVVHNLSFAAELLRIDEAFRAAGIPCVAWKGPVQAQLLYGGFTQRAFHDLDLLLLPAHLARAEAVLADLDYSSELRLTAAQRRSLLRHHHEQAFQRPPAYVVELHWQIAQRQYAIDYPIAGIIERAQRVPFQGRELLHPGPEDTVVLAALHAAKHAWIHGDLLRAVGHAARLVHDWELTWRLAESAHVRRYLGCGLLAGALLGHVQLPRVVAQRARSDRAAETLARALADRHRQQHIVPLRFSTVRGRERWIDRARMILRTITTPTINDWSASRLSDRWFFLYYFTRQGRLLRSMLSRVARTS